MNNDLTSLERERDLLEKRLKESPTSFLRNASPTSSDLNLSASMSSLEREINKIKSNQIRSKWYGDSSRMDDMPGQPDGAFIKLLTALQQPLNVIAGTAQHLVGEGTESSLLKNIEAARKRGTTFGDILQQKGVTNRGVQIPLGFTLDVLFDPINWMTAGTAALIPRAGIGLVKGGAKGLTTGVTSSLARKSHIGMRMVPFAEKTAQRAIKLAPEGQSLSWMDQYRNLATKGAQKFTGAKKTLGKRVTAGGKKYDELIGTDVLAKIETPKTPWGFKAGAVGAKIEDFIATKVPRGEDVVDFFKYSTEKANQIADLRDKVVVLSRKNNLILTKTLKEGEDILLDIKKAGLTKNSIIKLTQREADNVVAKADDVVSRSKKVSKGQIASDRYEAGGLSTGGVKVHDTLENAEDLLKMAGEDYNMKHLVEAYKITPFGRTGFKWYDDLIEKLKSTTVKDLKEGHLARNVLDDVARDSDELVKSVRSFGENFNDIRPLNTILKAYPAYIALFKSAKVVMSVSAHTVAVLGNFFMGAMMGIPVWKPTYFKEFVKANKLLRGKLSPKEMLEMLYTDVESLVHMAKHNPSRLKQLGIDADDILRKLQTEEILSSSVLREANLTEVKEALSTAYAHIDEAEAQIGRIKRAEQLSKTEAADIGKKIGGFETPGQKIIQANKMGGARTFEKTGSIAEIEMAGQNQMLTKLQNYFAKAAEEQPYNATTRALNTLLNSMPRWYEQIDQTFKIATTNYLKNIGVTEQELLTIARTVPLKANEVRKVIGESGEQLYRLSALKAQAVAVESFMNYSAMPDFVKMARAIPVVGSPFLAFQYAMAAKTGKTLLNNPAVFNKVGFMINEMNAGRSPQERAAMEEKYNQYLNEPTVVKMLGIMNTNVKNIVPYYTINTFNPSERRYDDSPRSKALQLLDKAPAFQDPIGQIIKDYVIQPWVLSGTGQIPQGSFGQPLYQAFDEEGKLRDKTLGSKLFYASRAGVESVVPGTLSYLGIPAALLPRDAIDYLPSYGMRNIAHALHGRSTIGADTKEQASRKALRAILGRAGIPMYALDVTRTKTE